MENEQFSDLPTPASASDLHDEIRRRAEEIYIQSGRIPGRDVANWTQAEYEVMQQAAERSRRAAIAAIIVRVNGVQYVGEYHPELAGGYVPGEFGAGTSVPVRLMGDKMYVKRPNGKELETTIVQKIS